MRLHDPEQHYEQSLLLRFSVIGLGVTCVVALVLSYILQAQLVDNALASAAELAAAQVNSAVGHSLSPEDLVSRLPAETHARIDNLVDQNLKAAGAIVRVKIWNTERLLVYSDDPRSIGQRDQGNPDLSAALNGKIEAEISNLTKAENIAERAFGTLLEVYVPLRAKGTDAIIGVYEIYQSTAALDKRIRNIRRAVALGVGGGFGALFLGLFWVVLGAARRLVEHSRENKRLAAEIEQAYDDTIEGWAAALDLKDHETEGHSRRVTELTVEVAAAMGMSAEELVIVRRGALLHDIGKVGVPDEILKKPGPLTEAEWVIMRQHPVYSRQMLQRVGYLGRALDIPCHHHERWDGTGYPDGLAGEAIPLSARIFAIIDVWDALSNDRPYRQAWPAARVLAYLEEQGGTHFDPAALATFLTVMRRRLNEATAG